MYSALSVGYVKVGRKERKHRQTTHVHKPRIYMYMYVSDVYYMDVVVIPLLISRGIHIVDDP